MLVDAENVSKMTLGLVGEVVNQCDTCRGASDNQSDIPTFRPGSPPSFPSRERLWFLFFIRRSGLVSFSGMMSLARVRSKDPFS